MGWSVVYSTHKPHLLEIAKSILEENAIRFVVIDKRDSMYNSILQPSIEIHIPSEDFILTKKLIAHIES